MSLSIFGRMPFTVPFVPTGIKHGVSISPRGVLRTPARAFPSLACTENWKPACTDRADSPGDPRISWIQQHGIPETEEAILLLHRNTVSVPHAVDSSKGHDHSQQGTPWQVEVGDHGVHDTELVPGRDEQF